MKDASGAQMDSDLSYDPLEETQQNLELPDLLAIRAARGLAHLNIDSAPPTETASEPRAAKAALVYVAVLFTVALLVTVRLLEAGSLS
jgi:hypothetical protein